MPTPSPSHKSLDLLSRLLFTPGHPSSKTEALAAEIAAISRDEFDDLVTLANLNHVIIRGMEIFLEIARDAHDEVRAEWASLRWRRSMRASTTRCPFCMRSVTPSRRKDWMSRSSSPWITGPTLAATWIFTPTPTRTAVAALMSKRFQAQIAARSWGDRLARKWNFDIPGLPEAVEIHMQRLGQTGEQVAIAAGLAGRARVVQVGEQTFRVPAVSDRLMISTLQRMYRHFYFRLCDIVDSAGLVEARAIDYQDLRFSAKVAGIWEGVATYLAIVSDYVKQYRGTGLDLPEIVTAAARFGGEQVFFARAFLRVPIMPQSAKLYGSQLTGMLQKGELQSSARLSLLPWLATAAAVGQKITGSDKGIW